MKIRNLFLFITTISLLFISCSNNEDFNSQTPEINKKVKLSNEELASIAFDTPYELTEQEVLKILNDFNYDEANSLKSRSTASNKILKKYYVNSNNEERTLTKSTSTSNIKNSLSIPIYEIEVVDGKKEGIAYISADSRSANVIAYIPLSGDSEDKGVGAKNLMLSLSEESVINYVEKIEKLRDSLRTQTLEKISNELSLNSGNINYEELKDYLVVGEISTKAKPVDNTPGITYGQIGPLVNAQWDQFAPFNIYLPQNPTIPSYRYPAGCGVIAAVQVLSAVKPAMTIEGTSLNWDIMTSSSYPYTSEQQKMVGLLVKNGYYGCKASTSFSGSSTGSTSTSVSNITSYLRNYINIDSSEKMNLDKMLSSMNMLRVVLMGGVAPDTGASHAWVIDGYRLTQKMNRQLVQQYDVYYHANLGWGGYNTGYYLIASDVTLTFETVTGTYNSNMWQLCNARRK